MIQVESFIERTSLFLSDWTSDISHKNKDYFVKKEVKKKVKR